MTSAFDYIESHKDIIKAEYLELLRIPSISTDPAYKEEVRRAAGWIKGKMEAAGLEAKLIDMPQGRHPLVLGSWNGAGSNAKTVLIYCHYDVQPAVVADGWHTEPFEPVERDGKIYARGATDSKVHVMAQLKAVEALIQTGTCPVNIKLLFEGEEESGGETINAFVKQHLDQAAADVVVISDGIIRAPQQPSLTYGLRGIITMEVHLTGPRQDLHSGHFGGTVHNPAQALAEIIARLHDENGRVTVPGFYDDVAELSTEERELLAASNAMMESEWQEVASAPTFWGEPEFSLHERIGARPTLEINGMSGGYTGDGFKTVLPSRAFAKISCRLVPHQDPERIYEQVRDYIVQLAPPSVSVRFDRIEAEAPAVLLDYNSPAMRAAYDAYHQGWGVEPVFERAGGSVPITSIMMQVTPHIAIMGFSYKGGVAHGPNENIYLDMFYKGIHTAILFLQKIGTGN